MHLFGSVGTCGDPVSHNIRAAPRPRLLLAPINVRVCAKPVGVRWYRRPENCGICPPACTSNGRQRLGQLSFDAIVILIRVICKSEVCEVFSAALLACRLSRVLLFTSSRGKRMKKKESASLLGGREWVLIRINKAFTGGCRGQVFRFFL